MRVPSAICLCVSLLCSVSTASAQSAVDRQKVIDAVNALPVVAPAKECNADGTPNGIDDDHDGYVDEGCKALPPPPNCIVTLASTSAQIPAAGGTASVPFTMAPANCGPRDWTASGAAWATVAPLTGSGAGSITYTVAANTGTTPRSETLTIAGQSFVLSQAAAAPTTKGCPPYPAFPDANCTGYLPTGVTLTPYTGPTTITVAGTVIEGKAISADLIIKASNVVIRTSKITGTVDTGYSAVTGVLLEDVEINGNRSTRACVGSSGFTLRRVNIHNCGQGISGYNFTLEDSFIHDLYGEGTVHSEAILGYTGNIVVRHNRLRGDYGLERAWSPTDGGMSSAVSFYTHGSWGRLTNVVFEQNHLSTGAGGTGKSGRGFANYCAYIGSEAGVEFSNARVRDNVFQRNGSLCGDKGNFVDHLTGPNACASNNRLDSPTGPIAAFGAPACAAQ